MKNLLANLLDRPIGVLSVSSVIVLLGLASLIGTPINLFSRGQAPSLTIITSLPDTNPQEMETLVTRKIEDAIGDVSGRKRTHSISRSGESIVTLEFHHGTDVSEASQEIRGRLRRLWKTLPQDTRFPVINRGNPQDAPILVLAVTSDEGLSVAADWARNHLKPELSRINGVASVRIAGGPEREIIVECDPGKLMALNMTTHTVATAISKGFKETPGGALRVQGARVAIRTTTPERTTTGISSQPIMATPSGSVITVNDVAHVSEKDVDPEEITRHNGRPLVTAVVFKAANHDLRSVWKDFSHWFESHKNTTGPRVSIVFNQAQELETALDRLLKILPLTLMGTAIVILVFLGSLSPTLTILAAAPFALMCALLILRLVGTSLDIMSIAGLILGFGVFVDHSIVVTESVSKRLENGSPPKEAIVEGVSEVALPLFLSTMATVVVFVPLVFVSREIKLLFLGFTWSITISLFASLLAALIPTPVLCQYVSPSSPDSKFCIDRYFSIQSAYMKLWNLGMRHPVLLVIISGAFISMAISFGLHLKYKSGIASETFGFKILVVTPPGVSKEKTDIETRFIENRLLMLGEIDRIYSETNGNQSTINVYFGRNIKPARLAWMGRQIESWFKERPGVQFHLVNLGTEGEERVISLNLTGPDLNSLMTIEGRIRKEILRIEGVRDVVVRQGNFSPVVEFPAYHAVLGHYGMTANELAHLLRGQLTGPVATKITGPNRTIQVRVRAKRELSEGLIPVERSIAHGSSGHPIPFMELSQPVGKLQPSELHRENGRPVIRLTLLIQDTDILTIVRKLEELLGASLEKGYDFGFGDEVRDVLRIRREMISAGLLGIGLIYLILVAATESFVKPVAILVAVPFAMAGAVIALYISGIAVTLPVYIGFIMLSGLVLNANIVMIHTINDFERAGFGPEEAIIAGARRRLRPILMTVFSAICGAIPMVLDRGEGSNMWGPFAITISAGMATSCVFALILTPLILLILKRAEQALRKMPYFRQASS